MTYRIAQVAELNWVYNHALLDHGESILSWLV